MDTVVTMTYDEYCKAAGDAVCVLLAVGGIAISVWGIKKGCHAAVKAINRYKINQRYKQIQREQAQSEQAEASKQELRAAVKAYKQGDNKPLTEWVSKHAAILYGQEHTSILLGVD
nr:MAG TPA: hypothetical protein [Herelleviridae sp.]